MRLNDLKNKMLQKFFHGEKDSSRRPDGAPGTGGTAAAAHDLYPYRIHGDEPAFCRI